MQQPELIVILTSFIDHEPQPGIFAAQINDVDGKIWTFIDKTAIFMTRYEMCYPTTGRTLCKILEERMKPSYGKELLVITDRGMYDAESDEEIPPIWVHEDQVIR